MEKIGKNRPAGACQAYGKARGAEEEEGEACY